MRNIFLAILAVAATALPVAAKIPGATHCYNDICHRVLTISETEARVGRADLILASHYGAPGRDRFNPRLETSSGEIFKPDRDDNVASPIYPDGTRLLLWNPASGHTVSVRVNNAGPYSRGRLIDTSEHVARKLGFYHQGVARIYAVVIAAPTPVEANYQRGRVYPPVPGYLGRFEHLKLAMLADNSGMTAMMRPGVQEERIASLAVKAAGVNQSGGASEPGQAASSTARLILASRTVAPQRASSDDRPATSGSAKALPAARPQVASIVRPRTPARQAVVAPTAPRHEGKPSTTRCVFDNGPSCS